MSAPEFFIDNDAHGDPWVWVKNGERPIPMLPLRRLVRRLTYDPHGPALLDLIRAAVEGEVREEWGVRIEPGGVFFKRVEQSARATAALWEPPLTVVRRTVITGAWEEER